MGTAEQTLSQTIFDAGPALHMYSASIDAWKKKHEVFVQTSKGQQGKPIAALNPGENTSAQLQKSGEDFFRRFVELQIEICRFFGKRWEQYLELPSELSHCHSTADIAHLQLAFLSKLANDYGMEDMRLAQAVQALLSNWMAAPMSFNTQQPTHH